MNKMMNGIRMPALTFGALLFSFFTLPANADPLMQFPTGDASWTVVLTYYGQQLAAPGAPPPQILPNGARASNARLLATSSRTGKITKVDVTQVGDKRRSVFTWSSGKTSESWIVKGFDYNIGEAPNGAVYILSSKLGSLGARLEHFDLSTFDWMTPDMLDQRPASYNGKECIHYQGMVSPGVQTVMVNGQLNSEVPLAQVPYQAWIDKTTLLPVAFDNSVRLAVFTFGPPAAGPLKMPEEIQSEVDRYVQALDLPKPYDTSRR